MARRYATALFDVAHAAGTTAPVGRSLADLSQLIDGHAELARVLTSPAVPAHAKRDVVVAVMKAAGTVPAELQRTMTMLADRDRLSELPDLAAAYAERQLEADKVVKADVVTAVPMSDASRAALSAALGKATGKSVTITERVDPAIVGGLVARVGTFVYDASVTRQLERLREKLTASS